MAKQKKGAPMIRQIEFGPIDFGHFDIGDIRGPGRFHFDVGDFGRHPVGSHNDDPWHQDRQFIDRGHGDGHQDQHTDDPDYPDDAYTDHGHADGHNDQHVDDPEYPDDSGHTDRWHTDDTHTDNTHTDNTHTDHHSEVGPHDDNHTDDPHDDGHADSPHDDGHDDSEFGGISRRQFQDVISQIQSVINQLIRKQQQTIHTTEHHLGDLSQKLNIAFEQVYKRITDLEGRMPPSQTGDDHPKRPPR